MASDDTDGSDDTYDSDDLESLCRRQQRIIEEQTETVEELRDRLAEQRETVEKIRRRADAPTEAGSSVTRRNALKMGGLLALFGAGVGAGTATANTEPTGRVGTDDRPIETLYTAAVAGPLTGGERVESLTGDGLKIEDGALVADVEPDDLSEPNDEEPDDLDAVFDGMEEDDDGFLLITNDHELQAMNADTSADYRLANGIDASLTDGWNVGRGFEPVGDDETPFEGEFDGDGHTVVGLTIVRSDDELGLFGHVGRDGIIENVGVEDVTVAGNDYTGGLVGWNEGDIHDSHTTGLVFGDEKVGGLVGTNPRDARRDVEVTDSYSACRVMGERFVGGLIGRHDREIVQESYATGTVSGDEFVGGLAGAVDGKVKESYATGTVSGDDTVGGLVGILIDAGEVVESYATGEVSGDDTVGGLVGGLRRDVLASYWDTESTGQDDGVGGDGGTFDAEGLTTDEMQGDDAEDNMDDFDFADVWDTVSEDDEDTDEDDYPVLQVLDRETQLEVRE